MYPTAGGRGSGSQAPLERAYGAMRQRDLVKRAIIDHNPSILRDIEERIWQHRPTDVPLLQPHPAYYTQLVPPVATPHQRASVVTTMFFHRSVARGEITRHKSPAYALRWHPDGRRVVTAQASGKFALWYGCTFNFETINLAHDNAFRAMGWSHDGQWLITGDDDGSVKYWQRNLNNVASFELHRQPIRSVSFSPTDLKFCTASDDGSLIVADFYTMRGEQRLVGHGADVRCAAWHPIKGLIASGSRNSQQPVKLWDPKSGRCIETLFNHKDAVLDVKWNVNGNWLLTASKDSLIKLFDIRVMKELQTCRAHAKDVTCVKWHPIFHDIFASGGGDGDLYFWQAGTEANIGGLKKAHEGNIWDLDWHPLGHVLATASNDTTIKFWTRNRPGDPMQDPYSLGQSPFESVDVSEGYGGRPSLPTLQTRFNPTLAHTVGGAPAAAAAGTAAANVTDPRRPQTLPGLGPTTSAPAPAPVPMETSPDGLPSLPGLR